MSAGRDALRYGLQALRGLGLRLTELAQMSPLSVATLKRHTRVVNPSFAVMGVSMEKLTLQGKEALTLIWVHSIASGRPLAPPVPQRAFLDFFCSICLTKPLAVRDAVRPQTHRGRPFDPSTAGGRAPGDLTEALTYGLETCEMGARVCASSPARFAAILLALRVHPWDAYAFVTGEIAPNRWWVRACLGCERDVVTDSVSTRLCPHCRARSRSPMSHEIMTPSGGPLRFQRRKSRWT